MAHTPQHSSTSQNPQCSYQAKVLVVRPPAFMKEGKSLPFLIFVVPENVSKRRIAVDYTTGLAVTSQNRRTLELWLQPEEKRN